MCIALVGIVMTKWGIGLAELIGRGTGDCDQAWGDWLVKLDRGLNPISFGS